MFVQVSVADVGVWYSRKEIYGNGPGVFDTGRGRGSGITRINGINLIEISCLIWLDALIDGVSLRWEGLSKKNSMMVGLDLITH